MTAVRGRPSLRSRAGRSLGRILLCLALVYIGFVAWLWWRQETLLFRPEALAADHRFDFAPDIHEETIAVEGAQLSALHLRLPNPRGLIFFLHGNGGNLDSWFANADFYRQANYDLFMVDYRGYGKSGGRIESQAQLLADVRAAWNHVASAYAGKPRVIYGRSLGTGPAAILAAAVQPELTVLVSPYCSLADMAQLTYPFVPTAILRYPLATCEAAPAIGGPLLLIHGDRDQFIPPAQSERIRERAPASDLVFIAGAGHDDVHLFDAYLALLRRRLAAL